MQRIALKVVIKTLLKSSSEKGAKKTNGNNLALTKVIYKGNIVVSSEAKRKLKMSILIVRLKSTGEIVNSFMGKNHSHAAEKAYDAGYCSSEYSWESR